MEIPDAEISLLTELIDNYISEENRKTASAIKGNITKTLNKLAKKYGAEATRKAALNTINFLTLVYLDNPRLKLWAQRLTPGSLYEEGDRTFGWYCQTQVQAEALPLTLRERDDYRVVITDFYGFNKDKEVWESRGFAEAESLPYIRVIDNEYEPNYLKVKVSKKAKFWWQCWGYAGAESLPYTRYDDRLEVDKNIKEHGWWMAYKWWAGCHRWYRDKHPEWFVDYD